VSDLDFFEPFLLRALLAGVALGIIAAPLGCLVVWRRMSYFGSTVAHAGLLGVALGIFLGIDLTLGVILVSVSVAVQLALLQRQSIVPSDSLLGLLSHAALALGLIAASKLAGQRLDLMGYLFGDILAVTRTDLMWIVIGGIPVLVVTWWLWPTLVAASVHAELAAAEGLNTRLAEAALTLILAFTVAVAMKIVGVLLIIAFLIMPAVAARPFAGTPERMVALSGVIGVACTIAGLLLSMTVDIPAGPGIVMILSLASLISIGATLVRGGS
jgi:zinc transport system permease protein